MDRLWLYFLKELEIVRTVAPQNLAELQELEWFQAHLARYVITQESFG